jgi:4-hydroxybenzoate polyprenyltransferase
MVKFSHSVFALPFALVATFMAGRQLPGGLPAVGQIALILLCMVAARSFAMTFNRIADAGIDAGNPRTAGRPLPAGRITIGQAWGFLLLSGMVFVLACAAFLPAYGNPWPGVLALPTLAVLAAYSYTKRFTSLAHFWLGAGIGFSPVAAWLAIHPASVGAVTLLLGAALCSWIAGFDLIYACQDVAVDRRDGLYSIPARFGVGRALLASRACHVLSVVALIGVGLIGGLGWLYFAGVAAAGVLLVVEQSVVRANDLSRVNLAFFTLNGCVSLLLGAAAVGDILVQRWIIGRPPG